MEHFDVVVVGAGLSGIGAGCHLKTTCPERSFVILEGRPRLGGTWDLFRYPGIRSDSDMYTLGYQFRPWTQPKAIADGASILDYITATAREYDLLRQIRFQHRVVAAEWSSSDARWTVEVAHGEAGERTQLTCSFLFSCSGYYRYASGYTPDFPGLSRFQGRVVHPQQWTADIDYAGKRVIVIGSGATAVTLVPALAEKAAHVTMLQRTPTYIASRPAEDELANRLRARLPAKLAYGLTRLKNVSLGMMFYQFARRRPEQTKRLLRKGVRHALGREYDVAKHFTPSYNPWDQRLCLVPDGDLFKSIRSGRASVVTDHIETFTERGIRLRSGDELEADLIVTATGLELEVLGGVSLCVDGRPVDVAEHLNYKGMMLSDVPNFAVAVGYTNASWTLKCDLTCAYVCRLLNYMAEHGYGAATPRNRDPSIRMEPWIGFSSSYVQRAVHKFPKQGHRAPWRLYQNYALDMLTLRYKPLQDGVLEFERRS